MTNDLLKLAFNVQGPGRFLSAFSLAAAVKNVRRMANSRPWICWYVFLLHPTADRHDIYRTSCVECPEYNVRFPFVFGFRSVATGIDSTDLYFYFYFIFYYYFHLCFH